MLIDGAAFEWHFAIGGPIAAALYWLFGRSSHPGGKLLLCAVVALILTPTVCAPFGTPYVEPASFVILFTVLDFFSPLFGVIYGILPVIIVMILLYAGLHAFRRNVA